MWLTQPVRPIPGIDAPVDDRQRRARALRAASFECGDAGVAEEAPQETLPVGMLGFLSGPLDELLLVLGLTVGAVWVVERRSRALLLAACRGLDEGVWAALHARRMGEGLVGGVAAIGAPLVLAGSDMDDPLPDVRLLTSSGLTALAAVPLVSRRQVRGVLLVGRRRRALAPAIETALAAAGSQLAVAIESAWLYQDHNAALSGIEQIQRSLSAERVALQRTLDAHERLTELLLAGGGLEAIAAALGAMVDNPVMVTDRYLNVIAWRAPEDEVDAHFAASTVHGKMTAVGGLEHATDLAAGGRRRVSVVRPSPEDGLLWPRVVSPVFAAGQVLGHVWVVERARRLVEIDFVVLEQTARAVALGMLRQRAVLEAETRLRGDFVEALLVGQRDPRALARDAAIIGFDLRAPHVVLVAAPDPREGAVDADEVPMQAMQELFEIVRSTSLAAWPDTLVACRPEGIVVLAGAVGAPGSDGRRLAERVQAAAAQHFPQFPVSVGLGGTCRGAADYPRACERAVKALRIVRSLGRRASVVDIDELDVYEALFDSASKDRLWAFVDRTLGPLREYDNAHASDIVRTLEVYLESGGSLAEAAKALVVHANTVEYRLRRASELCGRDLRDPEERFRLQLALRIARLTPEQPGSA
jgi:DNA-binding PucR family transcriptional regulator